MRASTIPTRTETGEQRALIESMAWHANQRPALRLLFAIPNGGKRHPAVAAQMQAEGARRGVPDLCLPVARGGYHGAYIEMKVKGGTVRPWQKEWLAALAAEGYFTAICWSAAEAEQVLLAYEAGALRREAQL